MKEVFFFLLDLMIHMFFVNGIFHVKALDLSSAAEIAYRQYQE